MLLIEPNKFRSFTAQLTIPPAIADSIPVVLRIKARRIKLRLASSAELLILFAKESDISVIVPRDESTVPHSAKQRPRYDLITNPELSANPVYFAQQFKLRKLDGAKLLGG